MSGQKPMAKRMQEMLAELQQMPHGRYVHYLDRKVLNRLIKNGDAKIVNGGSRTTLVEGLKRHVHRSHSYAVATFIPEIKEEVSTGGPYAKRRAALDEMGINYKGKNRGREKVVGKRKLTKAQQKALEKKQMWEKLKSEKGLTNT